MFALIFPPVLVLGVVVAGDDLGQDVGVHLARAEQDAWPLLQGKVLAGGSQNVVGHLLQSVGLETRNVQLQVTDVDLGPDVVGHRGVLGLEPGVPITAGGAAGQRGIDLNLVLLLRRGLLQLVLVLLHIMDNVHDRLEVLSLLGIQLRDVLVVQVPVQTVDRVVDQLVELLALIFVLLVVLHDFGQFGEIVADVGCGVKHDMVGVGHVFVLEEGGGSLGGGRVVVLADHALGVAHSGHPDDGVDEGLGQDAHEGVVEVAQVGIGLVIAVLVVAELHVATVVG